MKRIKANRETLNSEGEEERISGLHRMGYKNPVVELWRLNYSLILGLYGPIILKVGPNLKPKPSRRKQWEKPLVNWAYLKWALAQTCEVLQFKSYSKVGHWSN